jgi:hypothetical protein
VPAELLGDLLDGVFAFAVVAGFLIHLPGEFCLARAYRPDHQAWLQSVLRTALLHLSADQLRASISACARFEFFGSAIATVLPEPWIATHRRLAETGKRPVTAYPRR